METEESKNRIRSFPTRSRLLVKPQKTKKSVIKLVSNLVAFQAIGKFLRPFISFFRIVAINSLMSSTFATRFILLSLFFTAISIARGEEEFTGMQLKELEPGCGVIKFRCNSRSDCTALSRTRFSIYIMNDQGDRILMRHGGDRIWVGKDQFELQIPQKMYEFIKKKQAEGFTLGDAQYGTTKRPFKKTSFCDYPVHYTFSENVYKDIEKAKKLDLIGEFSLGKIRPQKDVE